MADDEKKLTNEEPEEKAENKDWQWDAAAPLANDDFLEITIPEKEEDEEITEEAADTDESDEAGEAVEDAAEESDEGEAENQISDTPAGCCIICGEKIRGKSEFYCNECRSKYMKVDFGATHIILSVIMVFVAVIGIVMFAATAKITGSVKEADRLADEGKISAASDAYYEIDNTVSALNERFNAFLQGISSNIEDVTLFDKGSNISKKEAVLLAKTFSISYDDSEGFFAVVENSFSDKELKSEKYAQVKGCYDYLKKFFNDYTKVNQDLQNVYNPFFETAYSGEADSDELKGQLKDVMKSVDEYAEKNSSISEGTMAYFKYTLLYYSSQYYGVPVSDSELYDLISKAYIGAGEYDYLYFQDIASFALNIEKYEDVISVSDKVLENNPSSADAYYYKSVAYLRLEKYDEAIKACDKVAELSPGEYDYCAIKASVLRRQEEFSAAVDVCESVPNESKSAEISRQEAIAYYLAGDEENALKYAKESYDSAYAASYNGGAFSLEVVNTSALIYKLCGDDEDYETIIETIEQSGAELEDSVKAVIKGNKTFEDLFMTGKGDI